MLFQRLLELAQISEPTPKLHKSILESVDELRTLQHHRKIEVPTLQSGGNPCFPTPEGSWLESTAGVCLISHFYFSSSRHSQVSRSSEGQQHHWDCCHCRVTFLLVQQEKVTVSRQSLRTLRQRWMAPNSGLILLAQWWSKYCCSYCYDSHLFQTKIHPGCQPVLSIDSKTCYIYEHKCIMQQC